MFISFYNDNIDAKDDGGLARYLDDVEDSLGKPGIGEVIKRKYNWIRGSTSYWWLVQQAGIQKWLDKDGIQGKVIFSEKNFSFDTLPRLLEDGPVILNTAGLGSTAGHIILAVGYDEENIICHDPYGDAKTNYANINGESVEYPKNYLVNYTGQMPICIYFKK
jgi:hypothetical protein